MFHGVYKVSKLGTYYKQETRKLYDFNGRGIEVLRAWPQPAAWRKTRRKPHWQQFRPKITITAGPLQERMRRLETPMDEDGQLILPCCVPAYEWGHIRAEIARLQWEGEIPQPIRDLIARFPERHWHLLAFLTRCGPAAADLVVSNPALAFALASNWVFHKPAVQQPLRSARALLKPGKSQRVIAAWLGFPATRSVRKVLARVVHPAIKISSLLYLRQALVASESRKVLTHLPRVNAGVVRIATDPALLPHVTPAFLEEVAHDPVEEHHPHAASILRDSLAMHQILFPNRSLPRGIARSDRLNAMHEVLIREINSGHRPATRIEFPPPPIPGTDTIVPITDSVELAEEGREQENCVASYVDRITLTKRVYIYRMMLPERCTLALAKHGEQWVLSELKRACNRPPSIASRRAVEAWLGQEQEEAST